MPPLECLVVPLRGFFYPLRPSYKTTYYPCLRKHIGKQHGVRCGSTYALSSQPCFLQRWTDWRSKDPGYWIVDAAAVSDSQMQSDVDKNITTGATAPDVESQLAHDLAVMKATEERRLAEEYDEGASNLDEGSECDTRSDWLRGCNWKNWFANKPLRVIISVSKLPKMTLLAERLHIGSWCGLDCVSEVANERIYV